jgi:hypothetical protein
VTVDELNTPKKICAKYKADSENGMAYQIKWQMMFDQLDAGNNDQVSLDHVQNEDDTEHNNDQAKQ